MELEQLIQLIEAVSESRLTDFRYEEDGVRLRLKKESAGTRAAGNAGFLSAAAVAAAPGGMQTAAQLSAAGENGDTQVLGTALTAEGASAAVHATVKTTASETAAPMPGGNIVKCPLVGVFYAAPAEDAKPYVSVGDTVKKGQILACVEAMKLMNEIESEYDGVVAEILVENGQGVGYGEPLFVIR